MTTQPKESEALNTKISPRGYSAVSPREDKDDDVWRRTSHRNDIELSAIENFSGHKQIDVDILLENMKVHPFPLPFEVIHLIKPSSAYFYLMHCFLVIFSSQKSI